MFRNAPCLEDPSLAYPSFCYSDMPALWSARQLDAGLPYLDVDFEYPVLTGAFIAVTRAVAVALPAPDPGLTFIGVNAVALFVCFLALVTLHAHLRPGNELLIAASPLIVLVGLINWDLFVVALTSAALLAWARGRPAAAGILLGLAAAAKLYPVLLLVPLVALGLRSGRWRALGVVTLGAGATFAAVNLPVLLAAPDRWFGIWSFHAARGADLGSVWLVLDQMGLGVPAVGPVSRVLLVVGLAGVAALALLAPYRPRVGQLAFLTVVWFCMVNVVYSPQYMLWLLPLLVLARPTWREGVVFTMAEAFYWWAVFAYLGDQLYAGNGEPYAYWFAVLVRLGVQGWLAARVVRDVVRPWEDPVRTGGVDDPTGGVLDGAPDVVWSSIGRGGSRWQGE